MRKPTEEDFLSDVAEHEIVVLNDDGLHRHLRFKQPGTILMHFDLVTYPGYLCYSGDMGCFVFSRVQDMFTFFRKPKGWTIDFNYWAEKLRAQDIPDGTKVYSPRRFVESIHSYLDDIEASDELREIVESDVESYSEDEYTARQAASEFRWEGKNVFQDFYEYDFRVFTFRFIWACYAIVWGIQQYDARKKLSA